MAKELLLDVTLRNAKPDDKDKRLNDGGGLYLLVKPNGAKWWRLDYTIASKRKTLSLGVYPSTGLADARRKAEAARSNVANGVDPSSIRKDNKATQLLEIENQKRLAEGLAIAGSFEFIATKWFQAKMLDMSPSHKTRVTSLLKNDLYPWLGSRPMAEIEGPELLKVIERIQDRGAVESAHRAMRICGQIFRYAYSKDLAKMDITRDLKGSLDSFKSGNFSAMTEPSQVAQLLRAIDAYSGSFIVKSALLLAPLVFVRPGELRQAEWAHIDLEAKEWRFLVTKTKVDHIVPLSLQAVEILSNIKPLTGHGRYVFPSARTPNGSRAMSDVALLAALRRMGIEKSEMTIHGFRAMARTILDEVLKFRTDFIEHQLAHAVKDPNGTAYNRTAHLAERHKMMQVWADYLDGLKAGAQVIAFKREAG